MEDVDILIANARGRGTPIFAHAIARIAFAGYKPFHDDTPHPSKRPPMRILITNDDGIHAPGLKLLEKIARTFTDDIFVVAPESDQSGVAHSLSLNNPLRLREISPRHFAVQGTPTDCVIMGVRKLMGDVRPDLLLSGVNRGQNAAEDVTYSGTIAAAIEGTLLGVPSIALSQAYAGVEKRDRPHWDTAEAHAPAVIQKILSIGIAPDVLINVNFPPCDAASVAGIEVTAQGRRVGQLLRVEERHDGRAIPYYWLMFQRAGASPGQGTDLEAIAAGKVSVTPIRLDMTAEAERLRYAEAFAKS
jgi:5'-nucleotidase